MDEQGYNGWKNYETWSVALIVNNEQSTQAEAFEVVRDAIENGRTSEVWTEDERQRYNVADALKDWIERSAEIEVKVGQTALSFLWSQLVSAALSEVDWDELAESFISDLDEVPS